MRLALNRTATAFVAACALLLIPACVSAQKFESSLQPIPRQICTGNRAYYPASADRGELPMRYRQRFEIRECGSGGLAQILAFESGKLKPSLVYTTYDTWPREVHHVANVLVIRLSGTAGGVLVVHFKGGRVQPVSGGASKAGISILQNDDASEVSVRLPHANRGRQTRTLRYPIEW